MFDNKQLLELIAVYQQWYKEGIEPTAKSFLYHNNTQLNVLAVSLMDNSAFEISPNWNEHFDRPLASREEIYQTEVTSCMNYLKLRKIKRLITENQKDMERSQDSTVLTNLVETHQHLKALEMDLARKMGAVILK